MSITNKAGLEPAYEVPTYKITTQQAHDYIQRRINAAMNYTRKQAAANGGDVSTIEDVELTLVTSTPTKKFCLFLVLLPMSATVGKKESRELSIFNPGAAGGGNQKIKPELYTIFKNYMFNDKERKLLGDATYRKMLGGLSVNTAGSLARHMTPRVDPMGISKKVSGCGKMVGFFIDPVRVFQDMLMAKDSGVKPEIAIEKSKKLSSNNFEYTVKVVGKVKENRNFLEDLTTSVNTALNTRMPKYNN